MYAASGGKDWRPSRGGKVDGVEADRLPRKGRLYFKDAPRDNHGVANVREGGWEQNGHATARPRARALYSGGSAKRAVGKSVGPIGDG